MSDLERLAEKYLWWEPPASGAQQTDRLLCQLMHLGTWDDVVLARRIFGDATFKRALTHASPGVLDARDWNFWNRFLGIEPVPPPPARPLP